MKIRMMSTCLIAGSLLTVRVAAQVPTMISTQGRISVAGVNFDGTGKFKFALVDGPQQSPQSLWSNDGSSSNGAEPSSHVQLPVVKGLYTVMLGDTAISNMVAVSPAVFTNSTVYLRTWFDDNAHGFQQLQPDQRIASVGFAMMAANVPDGSINSAKIAAGAVGSDQLALASVTGAQLAPNAVQSIHLAPGSIDNSKLSSPYQAGKISGADMTGFGMGPYTFSVTFAIPASTTPSVIVSPVTARPITPIVTQISNSGFTVSANMIDLFNPVIQPVSSMYYNPSLALVAGSPAIAITADSGGFAGKNLLYIRSADALGNTWGVPTIVAGYEFGSGRSAVNPCLTIVNGNPAICFSEGMQQTGGYKIIYIRAEDPLGSAWSAPVILDSTDGDYPSLFVVNGFPAVSYYDVSNRDLKFVRAADANGASWNTPSIIESGSNDIGASSVLRVVNGKPAIAYTDNTSFTLKYVIASNASGSTWGAKMSISNAGLVSSGIGFESISEKPAITYINKSSGAINYIIAGDASGVAWNIPVQLGTISCTSPNLFIVDGSPAVTADSASGVIYARATDAAGSTWESLHSFKSANPTENLGKPSGAYINGYPMVVTNFPYIFRASNSTGSNWTNFDINWIAVRP